MKKNLHLHQEITNDRKSLLPPNFYLNVPYNITVGGARFKASPIFSPPLD